jgi:CBS domain containing-hemolysin-like protein
MIWFLVALCWIVSFLFSGIEAGLLALNPIRLRHRAKSSDRGAQRLQKMLKQPERLLITVLLVTNAADIIALIILTHELVVRWGWIGYPIAVAIALPVYLFLLGVLPKSLFRRFPLRAVVRLSRLLEIVTKLLMPLHAIGALIERSIFARVKNPPRLFAGREELKMITIQSEKSGALSSAERAIIHNVVDFTAVKVRDVMVPLEKTVSFKTDDTRDKVLEISEKLGIDRFPIFGENTEPLGLINVYDILFDTGSSHSVRQYMRRIISASENESAHRVVRRLRAARIGLATVIDGHQRSIGIVALEDLVRQLVKA